MVHSGEQLRAAFSKLPETLQDAISSVETADKIKTIAKTHQLSDEQGGGLASETGLAMMGFTHPSQFAINLTHRLGISAEKARSIAADVTASIFGPVNGELKRLYNEPPAPPVPAAVRPGMPRPPVPMVPTPPGKTSPSVPPAALPSNERVRDWLK